MRVSKQNAGSSNAFSRQLWIMTVVTGTVVANIYYNQPLLNVMAASFHVPRAATGLVATVTQLGYASGLFFFVPWGDYVNRRHLILWLLGLSAAALAVAGLAPRLAWLNVASYAIGLTSVVPQILVPWAADLAPAGQRGRVVGLVMSGLLMGVLLARTVSGLLAAVIGWRGVFFVAGCFMLALSGAVRRGLPQTPPTVPLPAYRDLLTSLVTLVREQPELGRIALTGGTIFGAFSAFWTTLTFRLGLPPLQFSGSCYRTFWFSRGCGSRCCPDCRASRRPLRSPLDGMGFPWRPIPFIRVPGDAQQPAVGDSNGRRVIGFTHQRGPDFESGADVCAVPRSALSS